MAEGGGEVVCQGRCPACGRYVDLTLQRDGKVDRCVCGIEAVLVVEDGKLQRWFWRDPHDLPAKRLEIEN